MSAGTTFYHLVVPAEKTNYIPNPSFERDAVVTSPPWGWTATATGNLAFPYHETTSFGQRFGAVGVRLGYHEHVSGTVAITTGTLTLPASGTYTASCYVRGWTAGSIEAVITIGGHGAGTISDVGTTYWRRLSVTTGVPGTLTWVRVMVRRAGGAVGSAAVYLDAVQLEQGWLTTYVDGDQHGCVWLGAPHRSASYRPASVRSGGTMLPLVSLRAYVTGHAGVGMAPIANLAIDRFDRDGAMYQRSRSPERTITLTATIVGTSLRDLHWARRQLIDAVKPNATPYPQPLRLIYTGAGKELSLPVVYSGGLNVTAMDVVSDTVSLQLTAYDPVWEEIGHQGTILNGWVGLGTVQGVVWRDPHGRWGTLPGPGGTPFDHAIIHHVNAGRTGTIVVCGLFTTVAGSTAHRIAMLAGGSWGVLAGTNGSVGLSGGTPYVSVWGGNQTDLFVGGRFWTIAAGPGTALAMWRGPVSGTNGTWMVISGLGTASTAGGSAIVYDIVPYTGGTMLITGDFWATTPNGTSQGAAWMRNVCMPPVLMPIAEPIPGLGGTRIVHQARRLGPHQFLMLGSFTGPGGTTGGTHIASLIIADGTATWGTYRWQPGTTLGGGIVTRSGEIYTAVAASAAGSRGYFRVRRGGAIRLAGQGWGSAHQAPPIPWGRPIIETRAGNIIMLAGTLGALGRSMAWWPVQEYPYEQLLIAEYASGGWIPDLIVRTVLLSGTMVPYGLTESPDGTMYVWGHLWFAGNRPAVYPLVNDASHDVYPTFMWRGGRVTAIINRTTGEGIYGDLSIGHDDRAYIITDPTMPQVYSDRQGDMTSLLLPTSRLAGFRLMPGTNHVQIHAFSTIVVWWTPRYWSNDG